MLAPPPIVETRAALAPYVGAWLRCRGTAMRDGAYRWETFVARVDARVDGRWVRVASHAWVTGERLCRTWGRGVVLEFDARVRTYRTGDPEHGGTVTRYGLELPGSVVPLGRAVLVDAVREWVEVFGWDAVADAVERLHGEGS